MIPPFVRYYRITFENNEYISIFDDEAGFVNRHLHGFPECQLPDRNRSYLIIF